MANVGACLQAAGLVTTSGKIAARSQSVALNNAEQTAEANAARQRAAAAQAAKERAQQKEQQQKAAEEKAAKQRAAATSLKPKDKPATVGEVQCNSVASRFAAGPCHVDMPSGSSGGGAPSWLTDGVKWLWAHRATIEHTAVNIGVGFVAAAGTAVCVATVGCGLIEFSLGAAALFAAGVGTQYVVARKNNQRFTRGDVFGVLQSEAKGAASGALFGRGLVGAIILGPKTNSIYSQLVQEWDPEG
jgi:hypothetical protein